ncbi:hypothetical protein [Aliikangiella maris]|uniref:Uncharacterized protein n=2 Tax=Aliikangiella maris TaxID=3162458 RepID=A0ABV3MQA5_9GAMM
MLTHDELSSLSRLALGRQTQHEIYVISFEEMENVIKAVLPASQEKIRENWQKN